MNPSGKRIPWLATGVLALAAMLAPGAKAQSSTDIYFCLNSTSTNLTVQAETSCLARSTPGTPLAGYIVSYTLGFTRSSTGVLTPQLVLVRKVDYASNAFLRAFLEGSSNWSSMAIGIGLQNSTQSGGSSVTLAIKNPRITSFSQSPAADGSRVEETITISYSSLAIYDNLNGSSARIALPPSVAAGER